MINKEANVDVLKVDLTTSSEPSYYHFIYGYSSDITSISFYPQLLDTERQW